MGSMSISVKEIEVANPPRFFERKLLLFYPHKNIESNFD